MLKLLSIVFRFLFFLGGIISGFVLALVVVPLPGKTFFNRMSRLPNSAKDLIDHSIGLSVSLGRVVFTLSKEVNHKVQEGIKISKSKFAQIQEKLKQAREQQKGLSSRGKEKVKITNKK